jgi:putative FmdB family regulatory protein
MPLYEYECEACKQRFEVIHQKFSDPAPETCARCGKGPVHRQFSTPAIQFKGSGWYISDYGGGRSSAASSTGAGDGESKPESKSESKSESKKEGGDAKPAASSSTKSDTSSSSSSTSSSTSKD